MLAPSCRRFLVVVVLAWLGSATGCRPAADSTSGAQGPQLAPADRGSDATQSDSATDVRVSVVDRQGFDDFLAAQRGQVILVDFWATWCPPCVEGFPESVALAEKYRRQGLVVASMALEDPANPDPVLDFLRQHDANIPNFISAYGGADVRSADEFGLRSGTIPTLKLYDRSGVQRATYGDGESFSFEAIEVAIRELLLENP